MPVRGAENWPISLAGFELFPRAGQGNETVFGPSVCAGSMSDTSYRQRPNSVCPKNTGLSSGALHSDALRHVEVSKVEVSKCDGLRCIELAEMSAAEEDPRLERARSRLKSGLGVRFRGGGQAPNRTSMHQLAGNRARLDGPIPFGRTRLVRYAPGPVTVGGRPVLKPLHAWCILDVRDAKTL